jgi:oxygen-independent coproporphyrinogen-3 oxidase
VEALRAELELRADALDERFGGPRVRPPLETLYLGGGTPSLLPAAAIAALIELVRERYGLVGGAEVTLEANPGPDERGDAHAIREAGVTRLSIGAQSFDPVELRALGRRHCPADIADAVAAARSAGLESISLDLLYDVPGQTLDSWARSLDAALALEPDHVSLYALALDDPDEEGITGPTGDHLPLRDGARRWRERARRRQDEDRAASMNELADERLAAAGFQWYEISNWARPGHASRHNLGYWQGRAWEAVGPGAHAFDGMRRRWNAARLDGYLAALTPEAPVAGALRLPPGGVDEDVTPAELAILRLRTADGLPSESLDGELGQGLRWAVERRLASIDRDRVALTRAGRLLSNEVFARLL